MASPWKHPIHGVYYFRKAVPLALQEAVGRKEIRRSLDTKVPKLAKARHAEIALEIETEWDRLRAALGVERADDPAAAPRLVTLSQKDAHALAGEFYREFVAEHEENPGNADAWTRRLLRMTDSLPCRSATWARRTASGTMGCNPNSSRCAGSRARSVRSSSGGAWRWTLRASGCCAAPWRSP
jgi:hypothetical protein